MPSPVLGKIGYLLQSLAEPLAVRSMGSVAGISPSPSRPGIGMSVAWVWRRLVAWAAATGGLGLYGQVNVSYTSI